MQQYPKRGGGTGRRWWITPLSLLTPEYLVKSRAGGMWSLQTRIQHLECALHLSVRKRHSRYSRHGVQPCIDTKSILASYTLQGSYYWDILCLADQMLQILLFDKMKKNCPWIIFIKLSSCHLFCFLVCFCWQLSCCWVFVLFFSARFLYKLYLGAVKAGRKKRYLGISIYLCWPPMPAKAISAISTKTPNLTLCHRCKHLGF